MHVCNRWPAWKSHAKGTEMNVGRTVSSINNVFLFSTAGRKGELGEGSLLNPSVKFFISHNLLQKEFCFPALLSRFSLSRMNCLSPESGDARMARCSLLALETEDRTLSSRGSGRQDSDGGLRQAEVYAYVGEPENRQAWM